MENVELENGEIKILNIEQAIELCTNEYFNGKKTKINGTIFDIFNYGFEM